MSFSKSISVFHASIRENERRARLAGDQAEAKRWAKIEQCYQEVLHAANRGRPGTHPAVGRNHPHRLPRHPRRRSRAGRFEEGLLTVTSWLQGTSRDGDPQDHIHNQIARLVKTVSDGKHRALNTMSLRQVLGAVQAAALSEVAGCAFVDRRDFLALVGSELLLPVYMWRLNPGPLLAYRADGQPVTANLVGEVERLIAIRRHMDDEHGGGALLGMLDSDLRFVTGMLRHGRYTDQAGRSLSAAAAELARLAGWAAFDSGRQAAAQQYYLEGLRAANASGDHALAVNIVGFLGIQAYSAGRIADSVALMEAAAAECRPTPAIVQAMTWARYGRAQAKAGDNASARRSLDRASAFLGRTISGDTPAWAYWVDQTLSVVRVGHSGVRVGRTRADGDLPARSVADLHVGVGRVSEAEHGEWRAQHGWRCGKAGYLHGHRRAGSYGAEVFQLPSHHIGSGNSPQQDGFVDDYVQASEAGAYDFLTAHGGGHERADLVSGQTGPSGPASCGGAIAGLEQIRHDLDRVGPEQRAKSNSSCTTACCRYLS